MIVVTEARMDNFVRNVNALSRSYAPTVFYIIGTPKTFYESVQIHALKQNKVSI